MRKKGQTAIRATYMRGGTSKGVFFELADLPAEAREPGAARDRLLLRVIGSPDPYGKHTDGMGGATSSTSKVVIVSPSSRADCDVDYLFGQVAIDQARIDWSGNCGNLTAAVGPFAVARGLVAAPEQGWARVRIWQANLEKHIVVHVPVEQGEVVETGDFELDGVAFPAAEIRVEFLAPGAGPEDAGGAMFPTGNPIDMLEVPGVGRCEATLLNAGNPTIFFAAGSLGLAGTELQAQVNNDPALLGKAEAIRTHGAVRMGLAASVQAAADRPHTPKLCYVAAPLAYRASSGKMVRAEDVDLLTRIFSMGVLHHAMTGTGAVAIAAAAAVPGTLLDRLLGTRRGGTVRFGHPSGVLSVGAAAQSGPDGWTVSKVTMSRSARRLMDGSVFVPRD